MTLSLTWKIYTTRDRSRNGNANGILIDRFCRFSIKELESGSEYSEIAIAWREGVARVKEPRSKRVRGGEGGG